jgi:protein TonB
MNTLVQPPAGPERSVGLAVVVAVHLAAGALPASGLALDIVAATTKPLQMSLIAEAPPVPPPPPPPPRPEKRTERSRPEAPAPAYVPPPEVVPAVPAPPPAIVAVQTQAPPAPVPIALANPAAAPVAPPAAPAPAPAPESREIGLACPDYQTVLAQVLAEAYDRAGIAGAVHTRFTVRRGQVVEVTPVSGPPAYFKFVQAAVKRLRCSAAGADEVVVALDVHFAP